MGVSDIAGLPAWELVSKLPLFPRVPFSNTCLSKAGEERFCVLYGGCCACSEQAVVVTLLVRVGP